jgi:hypothetical protein
MKPLRKILLIVITTWVICQLAYLLLEKGMRNYYAYPMNRLTVLLKDTTRFDLLFLGSSRTYRHINPAIIDSICHLSSYNGGMEGANLLEQKMILEAYLENHPPPRCFVMTLDIPSFDLNRKFFDATLYFPFTKNKIIYNTLTENGYTLFPSRIFPFFVFTELDDYKRKICIAGLRGAKLVPDSLFRYKGFLSTGNESMQGAFRVVPGIDKKEISDSSIPYLENIINRCRKDNILLIFCYAPEYKKMLQQSYSNSTAVLTTIDSIASRNNIPFLRYDSLALCSDAGMFSSPGHLNPTGARVYSIILGRELNRWMSQ